jgi:hypothetical protein
MRSETDSDARDEEGNDMAKAAAKAKTVAKKKAPMKKPAAKKRTAKAS